MAKMKKRKDGRYQLNLYLEGGRRKTIYGKTPKDVKEKAARFTVQMDEAALEPEADPTAMSVWANDWVEKYVEDRKPQTLKSYRSAVKLYIVPYFQDTPITDIRPRSVQDFVYWLKKLDKGLSAKTIRNITGVLHKCFDTARRFELINSNPADNVELPPKKRPDLVYLEPGRIPTLLHYTEPDRFNVLIKTALYSGIRQGELLALRWEDVDFVAGEIHVHRSKNGFTPAGGVMFNDTTKNGKDRYVHIPASLIAILQRHKAEQTERRMLLGPAYENNRLVFAYDDGTPINARTVSKHFKNCAEAAGLDGLRFHDLRHTYAVMNLQAGIDIKVISENLGHYSTAFTYDVYSFVTRGTNRAAMDTLDTYLATL